MAKNVIVVYGSGASYASGYLVNIDIPSTLGNHSIIRPPTDRGFFGAINSEYIKQRYRALWRFKKLFTPQDISIGLEELWTSVDLNHKHITLDTYSWSEENDQYLMSGDISYPGMDLSDIRFDLFGRLDTSPGYNKYKFLGDCGRDFRQLVYDVYSVYTPPEQDNYYKILHDILLSTNLRVIGYLTFNYDCYLEDSLSGQDIRYVGENSNTSDIESLICLGFPIIKMHGSLNWEESYDHGLHKITYKFPPNNMGSQISPFYAADTKWKQPAIIPPTIYKQEINDDSRIDNHLSRAILQQWRAAIALLSAADIIIIVGYSFPNSDFHAKRIFQISHMVRKGNRNESPAIIYCCGSEEEEREKKSLIFDLYGRSIILRTFVDFENVKNKLNEMLNKIMAI